jgi:hypothetical protein
MKHNLIFFSRLLTILITIGALPTQAWCRAADLKDWTFLVFLNGNNSLDSFGSDDLNEMENVGSTDRINVVVQWASYAAPTVKRLLVQKDSNPTRVTSPIVQDLGAVDMGNWRNLVDFVAWAKVNYPAKHYFIDVWNHGSGWHKARSASDVSVKDISFDDKTGNVITTEDLGRAMSESARVLGQKVDVYGSDACLMAMAEVAGEMSDSVKIFVGSQELEPGPGWDYMGLLNGWQSLGPDAAPADVARTLAQTYRVSYEGGSQGTDDVTMSAFDLEKTQALNEAVHNFVASLVTSPTSWIAVFKRALGATQKFYYSDYVDLGDFMKNFSRMNPETDQRIMADIRTALADYVIANETTAQYRNAQGVSLWIPPSNWGFDGRKARYSALNFARQSQWLDVLNLVLVPAP